MPITVTIDYPITEAFMKPLGYGGRDPEIVDAILLKQNRISREIILSDDCRFIDSDKITVIRDSFDYPSQRDAIERAMTLERSRMWTIYPTVKGAPGGVEENHMDAAVNGSGNDDAVKNVNNREDVQ